jgi:hypothetical protein
MTDTSASSAPTPRTSRATASRVVLALAAVAAIALISGHLSYIPIWDGRGYAECAIEASLRGFAPFYLRCWGHASHFYLAVLAISQLFDRGNGVALIAVNGLVLALGAVGFHRLTRSVFPAREQELDRALLSAVFLLQPPFLASVLQPGLDLPVLVGTIWTIALLLERRWFWTAAAGIALVFSKETGIMLYALVLGCYATWLVRRSPGPLVARLRALLPTWPVVVPLVAVAVYLAFYKIFRPGQPALWTGEGTDTSLVKQFLVPRVNAYLGSYLALLFVLNFAWIPSSWLLADAVVGIGRFMRRLPRRTVEGAEPPVLMFVALLFAATVYALTRFLIFSNVRYLMIASALLLIPSYAALLRLSLATRLRRVSLVAYALLLVISAERTVDPISRRLWGTFPFGSHEMLRMTSITGECCGVGRDQLVYSLEFARLHELTDDALAALAPDSTTLLVIPANTSYYTIGPLDARTHRRSLRRTGTFEPVVVAHGEVMKDVRPARFTFLALPNANLPRALVNLGVYYEWGPPRRFERDGYAILAYDMTPRAVAATPQP